MATSAEHMTWAHWVGTKREYQAYQLLHVAFIVAPILAGLDKFFHVLTNWDMYLAPWIAALSPISGHNLMLLVGLIEIAAGIWVAFWPRSGAYVVAIWLWLIIINLLSYPGYFDIALRDFGLSLGALALGRLSHEFEHVQVTEARESAVTKL